MSEPPRDDQRSPGVLSYAGPDPERPSSISAGAVSLVCVVIGAVGLGFALRRDGWLGVGLYLCSAICAVILGLGGLIHSEPGERRSAAVAGLLLGLLLLSALFLGLGPRAPGYRVNRVKCAANLRQIGSGIMLYAHDHGNQLPTAIEQLHVSADIFPTIFICPASNLDASTGATTQQVLADLRTAKHCSYTYYGAGLTWPVDPNFILASEPLRDHDNDGINVLFGDGHVEWINAKKAAKVLAELVAGQNPPPSLLPPQPATGRSP